MRMIGTALVALLWSACSHSPASPDGGVDATAPHPDGGSSASDLPSTIGPAARPARLVPPRAHDGTTALPAVVLLHGYSATGDAQDFYFGLSRSAREAGFYAVVPDGTVDSAGNRFWNATPACCDFGGTGVDDVEYLTGLLDELEALVPISTIYLVGHSNGGFMSYRMACDLAERISAIASLAGSDFAGDGDCVPDVPVSVLQIHGDADDVVPYEGVAGLYPSASDVVLRWAERAGCETSESEAGPALDLETSLAGAETETLRYRSGCAGAEAELWTIRGGSHVPALNRTFAPAILEWLREHAR